MPELAVADSHAACVPQGCTRVSSQLIEPLLGTAPHAVAWLLLVHPGPWSAEAPSAVLNPVVAGELSRRCTEHHIRTVAVRRAGPQIPTQQLADARPRPESGSCYVASSQPGRTWIRRVPLTAHRDLLDLDLRAIANGNAPGVGEPVAGPLYAVCTHGKRDACCAAHGRPVHRALSRLAPGHVWESTHLGGHRFAANVLVLPEGMLYGRVNHDNVAGLVETHKRGQIVPALWRGCSAMPEPAQAAEWFARRATGLTGIDGVAIDQIHQTNGTGHGWTVRLRADGRPMTVTVERVATGRPRITGCTGDVADPGRWRLVALA
jgi:(2Fe-2S) ferredoxin